MNRVVWACAKSRLGEGRHMLDLVSGERVSELQLTYNR